MDTPHKGDNDDNNNNNNNNNIHVIDVAVPLIHNLPKLKQRKLQNLKTWPWRLNNIYITHLIGMRGQQKLPKISRKYRLNQETS